MPKRHSERIILGRFIPSIASMAAMLAPFTMQTVNA